MALLYSGGLTDSLSTQAIEHDITETTPGEVQSANLGATFDALPAVGLLRQQQRYNEAGPETPYGGAVDPRNSGSDVDAMAAERGPAPVRNTIQPEDANAQAKAAGAQGLTFDQPIADTTAKSIIDAHVTAQQRADVIARNGNSILSGGVARFATSSLLSLIDPINDAALMIPAAPEAFVAEKLAAASGAFGRGLIRGAAGAANGAVGMAALEPLNYAMSRADYDDWNAGDALRNIFMGAAMGAAGHMVLGGLFGREHLEAQKIDPGTAMDAMKAAIVQAAEDRPIDVADLINHAEATKAADNLDRWHQEQQRILSDADAAAPAGPAISDLTDSISHHENTLAQLREQAGQLRGEVDALTEKKITTGMDPETASRLDDVNHELGGVIPKARRAALEQERSMLLEGRGEMDVATGDPLEQARTDAQQQGLSAAAANLEKQASQVEMTLQGMKVQQEANEAAAQSARTSSDRAQRIAQAKIDSRESVLQNLMERDVRKFAATIGAKLEPGEATLMAREIRTAQPGEAQDIINNHLNTLAKRGGAKADVLGARVSDPTPTAGLRAEATGAAQDLAKKAMNPPADPEVVRATKANKATIETAPKVEGNAAVDHAAATKLEADAKAQFDQHMKFSPAASTVLDRKWLEAAGDTGAGTDLKKAGAALSARVQAALDRGDKVTLMTDSGGKAVEITGVNDGMMQDAKGQRWGSMAISADKEGVHIAPKDALPADLQNALDAADEMGKEGQAHADYAACLVGRGMFG